MTDTNEGSAEYVVINGWLAELVSGCTCGAGGTYGHEPGCGAEPLVQVTALLDAVERVRALHEPETDEFGNKWCNHCTFDYPCPTIRALGGE